MLLIITEAMAKARCEQQRYGNGAILPRTTQRARVIPFISASLLYRLCCGEITLEATR
jgi:hypothetical protein